MEQPDQPQMDSQDILKMLQQKIGNLELTVHALMNVLEKEELLDQERINEEAQEIVEEMQDISEGEIKEEVEQRVQETSNEEEE
jgi:hypothetical protein